MTSLFITAALVCSIGRIIDKTGGTWGTEQDVAALRTAKARCESYYGKEAPCLKKFIKIQDGIYQAICGLEDK